jgi:hypothetical protein
MNGFIPLLITKESSLQLLIDHTLRAGMKEPESSCKIGIHIQELPVFVWIIVELYTVDLPKATYNNGALLYVIATYNLLYNLQNDDLKANAFIMLDLTFFSQLILSLLWSDTLRVSSVSV